jgi:hypothetical protein
MHKSIVDDVLFLFSNGVMAKGDEFDLPFRVERWDDKDQHVEELIALTGDYRIARIVFDEAVRQRPGSLVTLRQRTRLLAESRRNE